MKVKELIKLLKECDLEKEVYCDSEGIHFSVSGINKQDKHFITKEEIVSIKE